MLLPPFGSIKREDCTSSPLLYEIKDLRQQQSSGSTTVGCSRYGLPRDQLELCGAELCSETFVLHLYFVTQSPML